jgi:hypothetical protein
MASRLRLRDVWEKFATWWMTDRSNNGAGGQSVLYRFIWTMIAPLDVLIDVATQGVQAAWPGRGTPTALPAIGRTRGMLRSQLESNDDYAARLLTWLDRAPQLGSQLSIARAIHEFLGNRPRVRVVNRNSVWTTVNADGSVETAETTGSGAFNWDGTSHPARANNYWDIWIIVYPEQWTPVAHIDDLDFDSTLGIGHLVTREEVDAVIGLVQKHKSATSFVRAIIFTSDATLFDPANPASMPNGNWGSWSTPGSDPRVASDRNTTTCRYWEPRP